MSCDGWICSKAKGVDKKILSINHKLDCFLLFRQRESLGLFFWMASNIVVVVVVVVVKAHLTIDMK